MPSYLKLYVQLENPMTTTLKVNSLLYLGPNKYGDIIYVTLIKKKQIGSTNHFSSVNNFFIFSKEKLSFIPGPFMTQHLLLKK